MHQFNPLFESKTLVSIDPEQNRFRFYFIALTQKGSDYSIERRLKTMPLSLKPISHSLDC